MPVWKTCKEMEKNISSWHTWIKREATLMWWMLGATPEDDPYHSDSFITSEDVCTVLAITHTQIKTPVLWAQILLTQVALRTLQSFRFNLLPSPSFGVWLPMIIQLLTASRSSAWEHSRTVLDLSDRCYFQHLTGNKYRPRSSNATLPELY